MLETAEKLKEQRKKPQEEVSSEQKEVPLSEEEKKIQQEKMEHDKYELEVAELEEEQEKLRKIDELEKKSGLNLDETQGKIAGEIKTLEKEVGDFRAEHHPEIKSEPKIEEVIENKDKEEENSELYNSKIIELRESAYRDKYERFTIVSENNGSLEFAESIGKKNFGNIDFQKIETAIKNGSEKIEIIHTHPLEAYPNYSQEEIKKIINGEIESNPMPPSNTDFVGWIQELNYFKTDSNRIENKIIDPTGEWTIKIDENNNFIKKYKKLAKYIENFEDEKFSKKELDLSEEDLKNAKSKKQLIENTHFEMREYALISDPKTKKIAEKIRKKYMEKIEEIFSKKEISDFGEIFLNEAFAITNKKTIKAEREVFIDKMIDKFKKYGINMAYKPFENKK